MKINEIFCEGIAILEESFQEAESSQI